MSEEEKWKRVNSAETIEDLKQAILDIAENGIIVGKTRDWDANKQVKAAQLIWDRASIPNTLTRSYGIRQQMLYLLYYNAIENE